MILHELITLDTDGRVDVHLPDGETIRFAGLALAEEWLDWADLALGESNSVRRGVAAEQGLQDRTTR